MTVPENTLLLKVEEAAKLLGVSRAMMYRLIQAGEIRTIHIGSCSRVIRRELEQWVADHHGVTITP